MVRRIDFLWFSLGVLRTFESPLFGAACFSITPLKIIKAKIKAKQKYIQTKTLFKIYSFSIKKSLIQKISRKMKQKQKTKFSEMNHIQTNNSTDKQHARKQSKE